MTQKCLLDSVTKVVVNVIVLEDGADWSAPAGTELAPQHDGSMGDTWDGTQFVKPVVEDPTEPVVQPSTTGTQVL
jgi:hypothetical protein